MSTAALTQPGARWIPDRRVTWAVLVAVIASVCMWLLPSVPRLLFFVLIGLAAFVLLPLLWREGYTWAILWLAPLAALGTLPTPGVRAGKYALIALAIGIAWSKRYVLPFQAGEWSRKPAGFVLALFAWLWLSALTGGSPVAGIIEAARLSAVVLVTYLWLTEPNRAGGRERWFWIWMIMGLCQVLICTGEAVLEGMVRSYGTLNNANGMGTYLIPTIGLAAAAAIRAPARGVRVASRLLLIILVFGLYLTGSRSSWLAVLVTLIVMAVMARRWLALGLAAGVFAVLFGIYMTNPLVHLTVDATLRLEGGLTHRPILWEAADRAWSHAPLIGYGLEAAGEPMDKEVRYPSPVHRQLVADIVEVGSPHNFYREMLVETGVVGLALLLMAVAVVWRTGWQARRSPDRWRGVYALAFSAITAGVLVQSYFERSVLLGSMSFAVFYWFLAAQTLRADEPPRVGRSAGTGPGVI